MPTYEYLCTSESCKHRFELFQSIRSRPQRKCPQCGNTAKRLISTGGGLIFRGSGFYITDYRKKEYVEKAKAEKSESASSSSEAQPAPKTDSTREPKAAAAEK